MPTSRRYPIQASLLRSGVCVSASMRLIAEHVGTGVGEPGRSD